MMHQISENMIEKYIAEWQEDGFPCKAEIWKDSVSGFFEFFILKEYLLGINRGYEHGFRGSLACAKRAIRCYAYPPSYTRFKKIRS